MLTEKRDYYKPFDYPWAFDAYLQQNQVHWMAEEVPLADDVYDWKFKMTPEEKSLVTQILRFFTQGDIDIASAYIEKYMQWFPKPELRMMFSAFANAEAIHVHAYSHLVDTLGLPESDYKIFHEYQEMEAKHSYLFKRTHEFNSRKQIAMDLAKFSAFGEGLQLFSSFAILMNFQRFGKLKGLGQIVSWSVRDESLHVESMIRLFSEFIDENPELWTDAFKKEIYQVCRDMVDLEDNFIDLAFEQGEIQGLTKDDMKQFIRYIADRRLLQLRLKPNYGVKKNPLPWFEDVLLGSELTNFFENKSTEYSKGVNRGDWSEAF